ncbi:hypothetical protein TRFO_33926 [Tritrichomonas foetus]|uniref:Glycosyl transferase family 28 C-terminal domain-containing protein n=1 Tax=Tritrichomonas foetus TaxID=1144522 RepID=A0A1J4JQS4_9EUKA|nr:hypothetical protein TRFO_33926 [Tritrichomonas foetus]|eukprot:OHS99596.1 hypothetical protein TRFO_33926 [Tritrichomonas foetus]
MIMIYCSSHGWGHCARMLPIIDQLFEYKIEIVTTAPEWLFTSSMTNKRRFPLQIRHLKTDPGCVQSDAFRMDIPKTIAAFKEIYDQYDIMLKNEVSLLLQREKVRLIISDISVFGQLVAESINVPSICIATFDWPFIYQNVRNIDPEFSHILDEIEVISQRFDYCLVPGTICKPLKIGKQQVQIHWDSRKPRLEKREVLESLGFSFDADLILLTFGGHMASSLPSQVWKKYKDFEFLVLVPDEKVTDLPPADNVHYLSDKKWSGYHTDLVNTCDLIIGKLGYGTCGEILHCKKPLLCVKRIENPECDFLTPVMKSAVPMIEITPEQFLAGDWDYIFELINVERGKEYVDYETDGEIQVAKWVRYILHDKEPRKPIDIHVVIACILTFLLILTFYRYFTDGKIF